MRIVKLMAAAIVASFCLTAFAQSSPEDLVKSTTQDVLDIIKNDKDIQAGNMRKSAELVEAKVIPYFDFNRMTALAVGKNWRQATPAQQKQLIQGFRTLLVRTYSGALNAYRNQTIDTKLQSQNDKEAVVRSNVRQPGGQNIPIDYAMTQGAQGWKVYDVNIDGVSLVSNYRSTFANEIQQSGIDGLINRLSDKNRSNESAPVAKSKQ